ncbi:ankyrin repeat domain-containing protein 50-like [Liolophura sinensis]|uniref:ankyrin repeat domain-containing protein 50-like n=1 Tax=Liolophura sinensis TaxID=3198878 RepID=UPI003157F9DD
MDDLQDAFSDDDPLYFFSQSYDDVTSSCLQPDLPVGTIVEELTPEERSHLAELHTVIKTNQESVILTEISKAVYRPLLNKHIVVEAAALCSCWRLFEEVLVAKSEDNHILAELVRSGKCPHFSADNSEKRRISKCLLHMAAALNMAHLTEFLIEAGCCINTSTLKANCTPVYLAVRHSHYDMVKLLLKHGANVNLLSCQHTPLMEAVEVGDEMMYKILLSSPHCDVNVCNNRRETALKLAAGVNETTAVARLLEAGAYPNQMDLHGRTALFDALTNGQTDMMMSLIKYGADVNVMDRNHQCPLLFAVHQNDVAITRLLLEAGANPNAESRDGFTLLQIAIYTDCAEIIQMLIDYKVDVNATNNCNYSALHIAAWDGYIESVELLLKAGAEHDNRTQDGNTPMALAAHSNHHNVLERLLPLGCAVNNMDKDLDTPLHYASYNGCLRSVKRLVSEGADPNVRNRFDTTPLWNAIFKNHVPVVRYLVHLNVDLEVASCGIDQHSNQHDVTLIYNEPHSPLWVALDNGYAEEIWILLAAGYNIWQEKWLSDSLLPQPDTTTKTLLEALRCKHSTPPDLLHLCKTFFRRTYKRHIHEVVNELEIPESLKHHILLKDIVLMSSYVHIAAL